MMEIPIVTILQPQGRDFVAQNAASNGFIAEFTAHLTATTTVDQAEALVVGVQSTDDGPVISAGGLDEDAVTSLQDQLEALGVKGKADEVTRIAGSTTGFNAKIVVLTGLGSTEPPAQGTPALDSSPTGEISAEALRRAAGAATAKLAGTSDITIALPADNAARLTAVAEGAAIGTYAFAGYKTQRDNGEENQNTIVALKFVTDLADADAILERATAVARATFITRDLVNTAPSHLFPGTFAEEVEALVENSKVTATIYDESALAEGGFGGLLGVGQGSANPPRLVKLEYTPENAKGHIALVGKGITFDTGGISLKPAGSMETMKSDMAGAATVAGVLHAVAEIDLEVKVTGWLAMAENMPSGTGIKPSDILTIRGGTTVEVMNTDAEGRLVLADALVAATEENPDVVVDIATLTGAAMVALGVRTTGIMGAKDVRTELVDAAATTGETVVDIPIPEEARAGFDSNVADLKNTGERYGGMQGAAAFLREFVGDTPWAHLDIAGPSFNESGSRGYTPKDATGTMVRTLIEFVANHAK
ncbi:leucyl aminopeptidase [Enteractinococcus coprophilus]|uniref:Probable cytosol aminopeptidase n=2 Tax=Enteractinococcus coprophilus TaxID=1027633 RepID=A0A543AJQ8_9MICC|nr:leucyl aminopeptidase [Enteractinococcus coprophilus]